MSNKDLDFSNYYICLATGEDRLLHELVKLRDQLPKSKSFHIEVTGLHTGDIMIGRVHGMNEENEWANKNFISQVIENFQPLLLIERKTITDFASSFRSNHYHSQKSRMIAFRDRTHCQCGLIVEEFNETKEFQSKIGTIPISTLEQCFTSIRIRDRFFVEHVDSIKDHARFILRSLKTIEKYSLYKENWANEKVVRENLQKDFSQSLKVRKKENVTPELCFKIQLSSIPGISLNMAEKLVEKYSTMPKMIKALEEEGSSCLEDINLGKMKFGKVKAKRVYDFLLMKES